MEQNNEPMPTQQLPEHTVTEPSAETNTPAVVAGVVLVLLLIFVGFYLYDDGSDNDLIAPVDSNGTEVQTDNDEFDDIDDELEAFNPEDLETQDAEVDAGLQTEL